MDNTFYLVRHGLTDFNEKKVFMGLLDIPLNKNGVSQALDLYKTMEDKSFDFAYSSPLSRARDTALICLGMAVPILNDDGTYILQFKKKEEYTHNIPLISEPRLAERCMGDLEGKSRERYQEEFSKYKEKNVTLSFQHKPDGGENLSDLEKRLMEFLDELDRKHENEQILLTSHHGPIRVLEKIFHGLSEEETLKISKPYCKLIRYER